MLLTQSEVATRLRVSVQTVAKLRKEGKLVALKTKPILIDSDDLEVYVCKLKSEAMVSITHGTTTRTMDVAGSKAFTRAITKRRLLTRSN